MLITHLRCLLLLVATYLYSTGVMGISSGSQVSKRSAYRRIGIGIG
jgi:hypothetical protein